MSGHLNSVSTTILQYKGKFTFERIGILLNDLKNKKETYHIDPVQYKNPTMDAYKLEHKDISEKRYIYKCSRY